MEMGMKPNVLEDIARDVRVALYILKCCANTNSAILAGTTTSE
jgi:hypothetical protein